jgi:hypothetical protein
MDEWTLTLISVHLKLKIVPVEKYLIHNIKTLKGMKINKRDKNITRWQKRHFKMKGWRSLPQHITTTLNEQYYCHNVTGMLSQKYQPSNNAINTRLHHQHQHPTTATIAQQQYCHNNTPPPNTTILQPPHFINNKMCPANKNP